MKYQKEFLNQIKNRLPKTVSFVDELAELLNVSNDSAYRRLRGETTLTFDEIALLSETYAVSIDSILGNDNEGVVSFYHKPIVEESFSLLNHLENITKILDQFASLGNGELIYAANEAKFGLFQVPEVAAFKLFFWRKTSYDFGKDKNKKFDFEEFVSEYSATVKQIVKSYVNLSTTEIINKDYLNSTLNQILFYYESGYFNSKVEAIMICDKLQELIDHNKREAELGFKFVKGSEEKGKEGNLQIYQNDVVYSDNVIASRVGDKYNSYLIINSINFMFSSNQSFGKQTYDYLLNLRNKSTLISVTAERERNMFYNSLSEKVQALKASLSF